MCAFCRFSLSPIAVHDRCLTASTKFLTTTVTKTKTWPSLGHFLLVFFFNRTSGWTHFDDTVTVLPVYTWVIYPMCVACSPGFVLLQRVVLWSIASSAIFLCFVPSIGLYIPQSRGHRVGPPVGRIEKCRNRLSRRYDGRSCSALRGHDKWLMTHPLWFVPDVLLAPFVRASVRSLFLSECTYTC